MNKLSLALLLALASSARSDARDPVPLVTGMGSGHPALSTSGDLSAVVSNTSSDAVALQVSDGRGLVWSPRLSLDPPGSSDTIQYRQPAVIGEKVFVVFADDRNDQGLLGTWTASTAFLRVYDAQTGVLGPELPIPMGVAPMHLGASSYDFVALEVGGAVHLHLAVVQQVLDTVTGTIGGAVVLYSSHDGGSSWLAPLTITQAAPEAFGKVRVVADAGQVSVLYQQDPSPTTFPVYDLFHQRSLDAGATADFAGPKLVPGALDVNNFDADLRGSLLAIAYEYDGLIYDFSRAITSSDGGVSYNAHVELEDPVLGAAKWAWTPRIAIAGTGSDVCAVAYVNAFVGGHQVVAFHSSNGGSTWADSERVDVGTGSHPEVIASGPGRNRVVVTWRPLIEFFSPTTVYAAVSFDRGKDFKAPFEVFDEGAGGYSLAWNELYQNVIATYGDTGEQLVGGFRPQRVVPLGFSSGGTSLSAGFLGFDDGANLAWMFLSTDTTSLPLPLGDGRELGVGPSTLFLDLLPLTLGGAFTSPIAPDGSGLTASVPLGAPGVPPGLQLHCVGVSFELGAGRFVDISDVVTINT
ncbi:MAG: sialidase family protein [Planctomycetota bacterium]|nr:sialidase family protein [Planctomycetota bacterium]